MVLATPRRIFAAPLIAIAMGLVGVITGGCATVAPYERETLARSDMSFDGAPEIAEAEAHATEVREGAQGGFGAGGGGCGCN